MKRRCKLFYLVTPQDRWWWCGALRRWLPADETPKTKMISSSRHCRTFDQAMRAARSVPTGEVIITQFAWRKGHRYARDYYYRRSRT